MYVEMGGAGSQSSSADIYLKLEFPVLFIPILASVCFRQLPSASVGFRGQWGTISTYIVGMQATMYLGGGAGSQSSRVDIYLKLEFSVLFIPILASVSFRGIPWAMGNHLHI